MVIDVMIALNQSFRIVDDFSIMVRIFQPNFFSKFFTMKFLSIINPLKRLNSTTTVTVFLALDNIT